MGLSPSQVILEAIRLATEVEIGALQELTSTFPKILKLDLVLRILLSYLPETVEPSLYTDFLRDLTLENFQINHNSQQEAFDSETSEEEANRQLRNLRLLTLRQNSSEVDSSVDLLSLFLVCRARLIDAETGNLSLVRELIEPFLDHSQYIRTWAISTLLPIIRLRHENFLPHNILHTLESFENLEREQVLDTLLAVDEPLKQEHLEEGQTGRGLRSLVGPWIYGASIRKRRKIGHRMKYSEELVKQPEEDSLDSEWSIVNEWLRRVSVTDLSRVTQAVEEWSGPGDVDYGDWGTEQVQETKSSTIATTAYLQTDLSILYSSPCTSANCLSQLKRILVRVALLANLASPLSPTDSDDAPTIDSVEPNFLSKISPSDLDPRRLQAVSNSLTTPSQAAVDLAGALLWSAQRLEALGHPLAIARVAQLCLFDSTPNSQTIEVLADDLPPSTSNIPSLSRDRSENQQKEFQKLMRSLRTRGVKDDLRWTQIRHELLQLRCWSTTASEPLGIFSRVDIDDFETELLQAYLITSRYKLAVDTYCKSKPQPIPPTLVHDIAVSFAFSSYDGASNGNMTRGGVRKARETLVAFQPYFPESEGIKSALVLISATHALSFYSLTLQHGIPFQPVNIRVHPDPISLISKVLDQNSRSYTKLEDLVEIGGNLVKAGMFRANGEKVDPVVYQEQRQLAITKQRIVAMAISASLAEEDFDTAYSYIVNRLQLAESSQAQDQPHQSEIAIFTPIPENDITWRAAYEAGQAPLGMGSGQSELRRLEQRMELLSQALLLAPINAVGEILETWRNCEEEMSAKATQEVQVEKIWDDQGSKTLPGNFTLEDVTQSIQKPRDMTRNALNEEAPMGLFDVARGAASALSRSAFPLRNPRSEILNVSSPAKSSPSSSIFSDQDGREGEGRVRKRDMVSNMVTGGLVSGIGWVLGAPPKE